MNSRLRTIQRTILLSFVIAAILGTSNALAQETIGGPYSPDENTVVLLHFNGDYTNQSNLEVADGEPIGLVSFSDAVAMEGLGQSVYLDNNNEEFNFVAVADTPAVDLTGDWTMEAWMRVDMWNEFNRFPRLIFKPGDPVFMSNWYLAPNRNGFVRNGFRHGSGWHNHDTASDLIEEDAWYHLTYIRDTERNATISLIHDQDKNLIWASKEFYPEGETPVTTDQPIHIGVNPGNGSMKFIGNVDEVRISNTVRQFSDVQIAFMSDVTALGSQTTDAPNYPVTANVDLFGAGDLEVVLLYRTNGTFQEIVMTNTEGTTFEATIPGQQGGSTVEYYIEARADGEVVSTAPSNALADDDFFKFNVNVPDQQVLDLNFERGRGTPRDQSMFRDDQTVTVVGNATYSSDAVEGEFSFLLNGTTYLEIADSPFLISPTVTVDLWFKPSHLPQPGTRLIAKQGLDDFAQANYQVWFEEGGVLRAAAAPGQAELTLDTPVEADTWYRVVYMISEGAVSLQLRDANNELIESKIEAIAEEPPVAEGPLRIGTAGEGQPFFTGRIDNVEIYNYPAVEGPVEIAGIDAPRVGSSEADNYFIEADVLHAGAGELDARVHYLGKFGWASIRMDRQEDGTLLGKITKQPAGVRIPYFVTVEASGEFVDEAPQGADRVENNLSFDIFQPFSQVLHLDFEEGSGLPKDGTAIYAENQDIKAFGAPMYSSETPRGNFALEFEGDSTFLEIDRQWLAAPEFTVDFWISPDELRGGVHPLIKQGDPTTTGRWQQGNYKFFLKRDETIHTASHMVDRGMSRGLLDLDSTLTAGSWYHITYEYSVDTAFVQLRDVNDEVIEEVGFVPDTPATQTWGTFRLGVGGNNRFFAGRIDDVRIFNYAVSQRAPEIDTVSVFTGVQEAGVEPFTIEAQVPGTPNVELHFRTDDGEFTTVPMAAGEDNLFTADIPNQPFGTVVEYFVSAEDEFGNRVTAPAGAETDGVFHRILVAEDEVLTLFLDFEEGSGTPEDKSDFAHTVEVFGNPTFSSDRIDGEFSMQFAEGDSSYLEVNSPFLSSGRFTVDFWFKVDEMEGIGGARMVAKQGDPSTTGAWWKPNYQVFLWKAGILRGASFVEGAGLNGGRLQIDSTIVEDKWYRAIYEFNEDSARVQIRDIDNNVVDEVATVAEGPAAETNGPFRIAHAGPADTKYFIGKIDNVRIYNHAISAAEVGTSSDGQEEIPSEFALLQNYPNPFNPTTTIEYTLPEAVEVSLKVFDVLGREVKTLVSRTMPAGRHQVEFDAVGLASGIYLYQLQIEDQVRTMKMILMK